jgi:2-dehydro-3-deoxygluconokinase
VGGGFPLRNIALIGEPLIELRIDADARITTAYGGDVANTAVTLARICDPASNSIYAVTSLGDSSYSQWLREQLQREHVRLREPAGHRGEPGIYGVPFATGTSTRFSYWREHSAARRFMQQLDPAQLDVLLQGIDLLIVTGISLALCSDASFEHLFAWASSHRARCEIVFDCNFRPKLWPELGKARERIGRFGAIAGLLVTGLEDESGLWNLNGLPAIVDRIHGIDGEYVIRAGADGCWVGRGLTYRQVPTRAANVVDAAGAGDAHLAGYAAARWMACEPQVAADYANRVAALVVGHAGSIPAPGLRFPPLLAR